MNWARLLRFVGYAWYFVAPVNVVFASCETNVPKQASGEIPVPAKKAGYIQKTFESTLTKSSIDIGDSRVPGMHWYVDQFFGRCPTSPDSISWDGDVFNLNGQISQCNPIGNASIATAAHRRLTKDWTGLAFGGGAYIEATLAFNPGNTVKAPKGTQWPAFWAMSIEHLAQTPNEQWQGAEPGYVHFAEVDIFEYDVWGFAGKDAYGGAVHDWFGRYKTTCPNLPFCHVTNSNGGGSNFSNFVVATPIGTDFTSPHRYGVLWMPATPSRQGSLEYYFDRNATSIRVSWQLFAKQLPPPGLNDWTFGVADQQHLALILSTGVNQPLTVKNIIVWQKNGCQNLSGSGTGATEILSGDNN